MKDFDFDFYSDKEKVFELLENKFNQYHLYSFIESDPISVPHLFTKKQDIEIAGLFAAIFAWGLRKTTINKSLELMNLMDNSPHEFILNHKSKDLIPLIHFKHRTFNSTDLLYIIEFLKLHYSNNLSLESAFIKGMKPQVENIKNGLIGFHHYLFSLPEYPNRTRKHFSNPEKNSTCKRLNMFLRWMVRPNKGVDFGIWKEINPSQLIMPMDLHVGRVALKLKLIDTLKADWIQAEHLTHSLKQLDPKDPTKYDFALFGLGIFEGLGK